MEKVRWTQQRIQILLDTRSKRELALPNKKKYLKSS